MISGKKYEEKKRSEHIEQGKKLVRGLEHKERIEKVKKLLTREDAFRS